MQESTDLEQLIFDLVEHRREDDFLTLMDMMAKRVVYVVLVAESIPESIQPGVAYKTGDKDQLKTRAMEVPDHGTWSWACTDPSLLPEYGPYAAIPWIQFLYMTSEAQELSGAMLQGVTSRLGFPREHVKYMLQNTDA